MLGTASAAFSRNEGSRIPWLADLQCKAEGQEALTVSYLQLGNPAILIQIIIMVICPASCSRLLLVPPLEWLVCICFPTPGRGLPNGSGLGLSRCLGPGECLHSLIHVFRIQLQVCQTRAVSTVYIGSQSATVQPGSSLPACPQNCYRLLLQVPHTFKLNAGSWEEVWWEFLDLEAKQILQGREGEDNKLSHSLSHSF